MIYNPQVAGMRDNECHSFQLKSTVVPGSNGSCLLDLAASADSSAAVACTSDGRISLCALNEARISSTAQFLGHTQRITEVKFPDPERPEIVASCSLDGTLRIWDARLGRETNRFGGILGGTKELNCMCFGQNLIGSGGDGVIRFWDSRSLNQLTEFAETHEKDVVKIAFHTQGLPKFFSASVDGHLCVFDVSRGLDEDEGFEGAQNLAPIEDFGFLGSGSESLWCRLSTEGVVVWNWSEFLNLSSNQGSSPSLQIADARPLLNQYSRVGDEEVGYFLGCHYDDGEDALLGFGGSWTGTVYAYRMNPHPQDDIQTDVFSSPTGKFTGGHKDAVRCIAVGRNKYSQQASLCITGGDDGCICCWV